MLWQFRNTGRRTGSFNMEYDERLAHSLVASDSAFIVRVYGWNPPAISLGWHQDVNEIDGAGAAAAGIDVVRRPTGGRAILHSDEVTYSVVMVASQKGVLTVYQSISEALTRGLSFLGAPVVLEKSQPHFPTLYRSPSAVACFASAARYEIQIAGRKLVGSAQRRYARPDGQEVVLQHGSILLGDDHLRIVDFMKQLDEHQRVRMRQELREKTVDLSSALGRRVEPDEVITALMRGFEEAWGIVFSAAESSQADASAVSFEAGIV